MIVSFFGHAELCSESIDKEKVVSFLEKEIGGKDVDFYLGNYGDFDKIAHGLAKEYQQRNSNAKLVFVTPYLNSVRHNDFAKKCDESIYPPLEKTPLRFAIVERNKWVVQQSDMIIFYYKRVGYTKKIYYYALLKKKKVFNLAQMTF